MTKFGSRIRLFSYTPCKYKVSCVIISVLGFCLFASNLVLSHLTVVTAREQKYKTDPSQSSFS